MSEDYQWLSCPVDCIEAYKTYIVSHNVPFEEEMKDGELTLRIPRRYRPHAWKLEFPT